MESKNTKNKSKRISSGILKQTRQIAPPMESIVTETFEKINTSNKNDNEIIFNEVIEKQDIFSNSSDNFHKKFLRINFVNKLKSNKKIISLYIPWILLVIFLILSFYFWSQLSEIKKDPLKAVKVETTETVAAISKIMVLPTGEDPKIATLTEADLSKVKLFNAYKAVVPRIK